MSTLNKQEVRIPLSLVKEIGVEEAFVYCYLSEKAKADGQNKVMISVEMIRSDTGLNEYCQRKVLKNLKEEGWVNIQIESRWKGRERRNVRCVLIRHGFPDGTNNIGQESTRNPQPKGLRHA